MTNLPGKIQLEVAQLYSLRNWIEYGFKQIKNELGWADFRLTDYQSIERWWEIVSSAYLLVSLHANQFKLSAANSNPKASYSSTASVSFQQVFTKHQWWESGTNWKSALNNLRLVIQPYIFYCLIRPWLKIFKIPAFQRAFLRLVGIMNSFRFFPISLAAVS